MPASREWLYKRLGCFGYHSLTRRAVQSRSSECHCSAYTVTQQHTTIDRQPLQ